MPAVVPRGFLPPPPRRARAEPWPQAVPPATAGVGPSFASSAQRPGRHRSSVPQSPQPPPGSWFPPPPPRCSSPQAHGAADGRAMPGFSPRPRDQRAGRGGVSHKTGPAGAVRGIPPPQRPNHDPFPLPPPSSPAAARTTPPSQPAGSVGPPLGGERTPTSAPVTSAPEGGVRWTAHREGCPQKRPAGDELAPCCPPASNALPHPRRPCGTASPGQPFVRDRGRMVAMASATETPPASRAQYPPRRWWSSVVRVVVVVERRNSQPPTSRPSASHAGQSPNPGPAASPLRPYHPLRGAWVSEGIVGHQAPVSVERGHRQTQQPCPRTGDWQRLPALRHPGPSGPSLRWASPSVMVNLPETA